jgi:hypothetical protein
MHCDWYGRDTDSLAHATFVCSGIKHDVYDAQNMLYFHQPNLEFTVHASMHMCFSI